MSAAALRSASFRRSSGRRRAREIDEAGDGGIEDIDQLFTTEDLAPGEVIVASDPAFERRPAPRCAFLADSHTRTARDVHALQWVRFVDGIHFFARERREEVRLPGY